jgi:hypothetical protein
MIQGIVKNFHCMTKLVQFNCVLVQFLIYGYLLTFQLKTCWNHFNFVRSTKHLKLFTYYWSRPIYSVINLLNRLYFVYNLYINTLQFQLFRKYLFHDIVDGFVLEVCLLYTKYSEGVFLVCWTLLLFSRWHFLRSSCAWQSFPWSDDIIEPLVLTSGLRSSNFFESVSFISNGFSERFSSSNNIYFAINNC